MKRRCVGHRDEGGMSLNKSLRALSLWGFGRTLTILQDSVFFTHKQDFPQNLQNVLVCEASLIISDVGVAGWNSSLSSSLLEVFVAMLQ